MSPCKGESCLSRPLRIDQNSHAMGVAAVLGELALQALVDVGPVGGAEPAPFDEQVGQGRALASGPGGARLGELGSVQEVGLEREHAEKQVAVGGLGGHGGDLAVRIRVNVRTFSL